MPETTNRLIPGVSEAAFEEAKILFGFCATFLAGRFDEPKPIPPLHVEMWSLCCSVYAYVAMAAPRGHAKSTAITFVYVLYMLLFKKRAHLLIIGSNETLASAFLNDVKIELQENDALREFFKIDKFLKDTGTELVVQFQDGKRFRIICKGAGQRMRGLKWERKRPDFVVFDDMEDEDVVLSEARREKFRSWFLGAVKPILKRGGIIRGVGTIIGYDSFLENLMPPEKSEHTVIEELRTYSTDVTRSWLSIKYRAHNEDFSEILWPEQFTEEWLRAERQDYANHGKLDIYGQEYLNDPIDESVSYYRKSDFRPMTDAQKLMRMTYYTATDLAISESNRAAYTVFLTAGVLENGDICVVDVRRARIDGLAICEEFFSVHSRWKPDIMRVEEENIQRSLGPILYKMMDERNEYLPIDTKVPTKDKDRRSRSMQARARAGKLYVDMDAEWAPDFLEELTRYPKSAYADQFDALGWLGLMLDDITTPHTDQEFDDEEYGIMVQETSGFDGRDEMTGY